MLRIKARLSSGTASHQSRKRSRPACETLEARSLPSFSPLSLVMPAAPPIHPAIAAPVMTQSDGRIEALYQLSLTRHPLYQSIRGSHVLKAPMFYANYTGPKRTDLDVIGANVRITPGEEFNFAGKVLGTIDVAEPAVYVFLINRGGAGSPGPIKDRPGISYDATVKVAIGSSGTTGTVTLLNVNEQVQSVVTLPTTAIRVVDNTVIVTASASLLPPSNPSAAHSGIAGYRYAFAAEIPGGSLQDVAGLAPEFASIPV
jgi:hypothetical protein